MKVEDIMGVLKFKYPDSKYGVAEVEFEDIGEITSWVSNEVQPTIEELQVIFNSPEYAAFLSKQTNDISNSPIKQSLNDIDASSIRSLREWLVTQPTAPQFIKDYEAQAQSIRSKLK